ncbi:putative TPR repeat, SEL1 subfamily fused with Heat shock protein DnaJ [Vibrio nigripulchritudo MADA3029]|nr:putative TPR repeat, SEL1 subfamily fused with Heat shock protein DnaJ [Vibrio nigripulchritudo MADA3020]CCN54274.1 putative TPR repeat, SEL1 subfamily fused with Heat shock protein DnaJ [Vibrio nigripulchritudo MADA3021]CCN61344.1 putative TPR repeat, SEL1 subfamily fused with Heat shock protein DnaJ [Vibrio nigripulchritudo MADA3029]
MSLLLPTTEKVRSFGYIEFNVRISPKGAVFISIELSMKRFFILAAIIYSIVLTKAFAVPIEELEAKANNQDPVAQYSLAQAFFQGNGVPKDPQSAIVWLRNSAENGYPLAQLKLANAYDSGLAIEENRALAIYWYTKSAVQGLARAQLKLGAIYERSFRETKSVAALDSAEIWYRVAMENNSHQAEAAYNRVLESKFNYRKAAQLGQFEELDKAHEDSLTTLDNPIPPPQPVVKDFQWYLKTYQQELIYGGAGIVGVLLLLILFVLMRKGRQKNKNAELESKVSEQNQQSKKLRRELERAHKQILKQNGLIEEMKSASQDQKFHIACAVFGFNPKRLPKKDVIKNRYKKLCRVYHPDANGSDEEMRRLNTALKLILQQNVN